MKFSYGLPVALIGAAAITSLSFAYALVQPQLAMALTTDEVYDLAAEVAVRIDGPTGGLSNGTGVIVDKQGNTYTVLTNWHVVKTSGSYVLTTSDDQRHVVNASQIQQLPGVDLAMLQFTSNQNYRVVERGNSDLVRSGQLVYVAGWPNQSQAISERIFTPTQGRIVTRLSRPKDGYALAYDNLARPGMSGGPVLDEQGRLIAINGRADVDLSGAAGLVLGIPINTFENLRRTLGNTAQRPSGPSTPPRSQPIERSAPARTPVENLPPPPPASTGRSLANLPPPPPPPASTRTPVENLPPPPPASTRTPTPTPVAVAPPPPRPATNIDGNNSNQTTGINTRFTFTRLGAYNSCVEDILLLYQDKERFRQQGRRGDCLADVFQTYANTGLSKYQALDLIKAANTYVSTALTTKFYPLRGLRMQVAKLLGFIYELDANDQEIMQLIRESSSSAGNVN